MAHLENYQETPEFGSKVNCAKCSRYIPRRELMRDGYTMSMVCGKCWDPAEEPDYPVRANIPEVPK